MFEKCPNCSRRVMKGSKFCTHCGERLPQEAKHERRKVIKNFQGFDFTKVKKIINHYQSYFLERLQDPTVSMKKSMNKESFQFGLVQLVIFIVLNSATVLTLFRKGNTGLAPYLNISMVSIFMGALVLQALFLMNMAVSLYVSTNYLKKVPTTIETILARVGGLAAPQLVLSFILYFSVLFGINTVYYVVLSLIVIISFIKISFYLLSIKNNSTLPNFYIVIVTTGLLLILQVILYGIIMRFSTNPQLYPEIISRVLR